MCGVAKHRGWQHIALGMLVREVWSPYFFAVQLVRGMRLHRHWVARLS